MKNAVIRWSFGGSDVQAPLPVQVSSVFYSILFVPYPRLISDFELMTDSSDK